MIETWVTSTTVTAAETAIMQARAKSDDFMALVFTILMCVGIFLIADMCINGRK